MNEQNPDKTVPPRESTQTQRFQPAPDDLDLTNPDIRLPESAVVEGQYENPLEELLSVDEQVKALQKRVDLLNRYIEHKTFEYGGLKAMNPKFNLDLELSGVDENGMEFVVPRDQVEIFLKSGK